MKSVDLSASRLARLKPPYRLVVVDMDGTYLNSAGQISERNHKLASTLQQRGVHFVIATGRPSAVLQPLINEMGVASLPTVTFNGACLQHARANLPSTPLWYDAIEAAKAREVVALCTEQLGLGISYSTRATSYFVASTPEQREKLSTYERLEKVAQDHVLGSAAELFAVDSLPLALKIVALTPTPDAHAADARAALSGRGIHVISAEMHIEFVNEHVNKAAALRRLCDVLGVPLAGVVAFGDAMNDLEMLSSVGLGVAMKNAREAVKAVAAETCDFTNDEDGVARRCEALIAQGLL